MEDNSMMCLVVEVVPPAVMAIEDWHVSMGKFYLLIDEVVVGMVRPTSYRHIGNLVTDIRVEPIGDTNFMVAGKPLFMEYQGNNGKTRFMGGPVFYSFDGRPEDATEYPNVRIVPTFTMDMVLGRGVKAAL